VGQAGLRVQGWGSNFGRRASGAGYWVSCVGCRIQGELWSGWFLAGVFRMSILRCVCIEQQQFG
jgi:hypothetical protein